MDIANKKFKNNVTGNVVKVIDSFEDIAILENKQKVKVSDLTNVNKYTEEIDPESFFNNQQAYNDLANKIKNINTNDIVDEEGGVTVNIEGDENFKPATTESAVMQTTEEHEKELLARKYGVPTDNSASEKQNAAFDKILNPEVEPEAEPEFGKLVVGDEEMSMKQKTYVKPSPQIRQDDPILSMFRNTKRKVDLNTFITLNEKIPRLDFIELMEDSYNISIIEFLADEFTDKILKDPIILRDLIKSQIIRLVYPGGLDGPQGANGPGSDPVGVQDDTPIISKKIKKSNKPTAKDRIEFVEKIETIDGVKEYIKKEKAKTVLKAAQLRISELAKKI